MRDDRSDNSVNEDSGGPESSVGRRLREKRRRLGISVQQAAQDLHLDGWIIEALEADNFSALGAPVFAKGHLRKYAELLGLEPDDLMIDYYQSEDRPENPWLVTDSAVTGSRIKAGFVMRLIIVLGVVGLAMLLAWFLLGNGTKAVSIEPAAEAPPSADVMDTQDALVPEPADIALASITEAKPSELESAPEADEQPQESALIAAAVVEPVDESPEFLLPPSGAVQLTVRFSQDSWIEINDAQNNRMMYRMGKAGTVRQVFGIPPIRVYLGFADGVSIDVDGTQYPIPASPTGRDIRRFTIQAPATE